MGTIKQGILGGFSGKVAGVVGSSWKGIAVIKSRPLSVANPRTAAQTNQRTKFSAVVACASTVLATIVKPLWDRFAQGESGYNAFVKTNIDAFDSYGLPIVANIKSSVGKMAATPIDTMVSTDGSTTVNFTWTNDSGTGLKLATDEAYIMLYDDSQETFYGYATGITRVIGAASVEIDVACATGDQFSGYLSFRRADGTVVSDSSYKFYETL